MTRKFKRKVEQEQYEKAITHSYPMTFEKDQIGGSFADAFNAGYKGLKGGIYRLKRGSAGYIFYMAGKDRKKLDEKEISINLHHYKYEQCDKSCPLEIYRKHGMKCCKEWNE